MLQDITINNTTPVIATERTSGGPVYVQADGTFGGTTLTVRASYDGGTTKTTLFTLTAAGFQNADVAPGAVIEVAAVGGSGINLKVMIR